MTKQQRKKIAATIAFLLIVTVVAGIAWDFYQRQKQMNACLSRLRQIDSVQTCCIPLSKNVNEGDSMSPADALPFFQEKDIFNCPSGAPYIISWVVGGPYPKCPVHGDLLQLHHGPRHIEEGVKRKTETDVEFQKRMDEFEKTHPIGK